MREKGTVYHDHEIAFLVFRIIVKHGVQLGKKSPMSTEETCLLKRRGRLLRNTCR